MRRVIKMIDHRPEADALASQPEPMEPKHQVVVLPTGPLVILVPAVHRQEIGAEHRDIAPAGTAAVTIEPDAGGSREAAGAENQAVVESAVLAAESTLDLVPASGLELA